MAERGEERSGTEEHFEGLWCESCRGLLGTGIKGMMGDDGDAILEAIILTM